MKNIQVHRVLLMVKMTRQRSAELEVLRGLQTSAVLSFISIVRLFRSSMWQKGRQKRILSGLLVCLLLWCHQNKQMFYFGSAGCVWRAGEEQKCTYLEIPRELYEWEIMIIINECKNKWASKQINVHQDPTSNCPWPIFMDIRCKCIFLHLVPVH